MADGFEGRHIVVTGGTGALGGSVLKRLVEDGATCHVPTSQASAPPQFEFSGSGRVVVAPGVDLTDQAAVESFYGSIPELWASIHLAGGFSMAALTDTSADDFAAMMDMNARTAFLCCRSAAKSMFASNTAGRMVNVTARPGLDLRKGAGMAAYASSKAAVAALTVALAEELKGTGILLNAVAPSTLDTPANRAAMPKADFAKWVSLDDAAEAICHLASPGNRATSGALVTLYGKA